LSRDEFRLASLEDDNSHISTGHIQSICFSTYLWTESIRKTQLQQTEAKPYFQRLGRTEYGHAEQLSEKEYQMSKDILIGKK
jgi:hypothetical protein